MIEKIKDFKSQFYHNDKIRDLRSQLYHIDKEIDRKQKELEELDDKRLPIMKKLNAELEQLKTAYTVKIFDSHNVYQHDCDTLEECLEEIKIAFNKSIKPLDVTISNNHLKD